MKLFFGLVLITCTASAQLPPVAESVKKEKSSVKWKLDHNKLMTGGLVFMAGTSKGFNETLTFHWKYFHKNFPGAAAHWFNPAISWKNKYKDGDVSKGARFPLSRSILVMTTDQYHLNNFIGRVSWMAAIIIKIGEGKKPLTYYLRDIIYYSACHQLGFALSYYPFVQPKSSK